MKVSSGWSLVLGGYISELREKAYYEGRVVEVGLLARAYRRLVSAVRVSAGGSKVRMEEMGAERIENEWKRVFGRVLQELGRLGEIDKLSVLVVGGSFDAGGRRVAFELLERAGSVSYYSGGGGHLRYLHRVEREELSFRRFDAVVVLGRVPAEDVELVVSAGGCVIDACGELVGCSGVVFV